MSAELLKTYAKEFRKERYRPEPIRSLFHFFKFLAFVGVFFVAQFWLLRSGINGIRCWSLAIAISFFHGLTYLSLWLIGHDCGHNAFSKNQRLNQLVGSLATSFMLMNYENFRRSHNMHHHFVANIEKDEAFGPKARRKDFLLQRIVRSIVLIPFLAYLIGILLPRLTKTPGYVNYFWPDETKASQRAFAFVLGHLLVLVLMAFFLPILYLLLAGVVPILVGWAFFLITTFLNHTGANTVWLPDDIWTHEKGVFNTVNLSYGSVIDYFLLGLGRDHFAHHINPSIPHYKLRSATDFIGDSHPNNRIVKGNLLRFVYYYYKYSLQRIFRGYFVDDGRPFRYE